MGCLKTIEVVFTNHFSFWIALHILGCMQGHRGFGQPHFVSMTDIDFFFETTRVPLYRNFEPMQT